MRLAGPQQASSAAISAGLFPASTAKAWSMCCTPWPPNSRPKVAQPRLRRVNAGKPGVGFAVTAVTKLMGSVAAIHRQIGACHIPRSFAQEENDRTAEIAVIGHALEKSGS